MRGIPLAALILLFRYSLNEQTEKNVVHTYRGNRDPSYNGRRRIYNYKRSLRAPIKR